ncbi:putative entry exclusion protein TrbK-alt [Mesorhizobium australicum]|uniref:Conjugative transfer region protein TrbK n=1 Tax=Mesorhizobium australicum TaxID=536018 RepID=A0A1X7NRX5_9HYPH|nr:putative entry exclusion protein TrbK-alt [Mesorhizobium australicum]SMH40842.1 conjugative transfer region protein TrbK [Mesorhizobium australicum]
MDGKMLARLAAVVAIAVAVTAAATHLARDGKPTGPQSSPPTAIDTPRPDPLRETLGRCREMGEAATRNPECLAAWDENRRHFLSPTPGN